MGLQIKKRMLLYKTITVIIIILRLAYEEENSFGTDRNFKII